MASTADGRYRSELVPQVERSRPSSDLPESVRPYDFDLPESGWEHAVLLFESTWCGACKSLRAGVVDRPEFTRVVSVTAFLAIDVDREVALPQRYAVCAIPTILMIDRRGTILLRIVDPVPASLIEQVLGVLEKG